MKVEECLRGRLAALSRHQDCPQHVLAFSRLLATLELFQQFPLVTFDQACENEYQQLRKLRLRVGSQDLRIAATARVHGLVVLTRNQRDFVQIPGLVVEDWSL